MDNYLERVRRTHELREQLENAMVREIVSKRTTIREKINSDFMVKSYLDRYTEATRKLLDLYVDSKGAGKAEINNMTTGNEFVEFYSRLKKLRDFHKANPDLTSIPLSVEFSKQRKNRSNNDTVLVDFTDEEGYGKFLDLNEQFNLYQNTKCLPDITAIDYLSFIKNITAFENIPREKKFTGLFQQYLDSLISYLENYIQRSKPLLSIQNILEQWKEEFENSWKVGELPGWEKEVSSALSNTGSGLELETFQNVEEIAALGLDRLKSALIALGLKCGGTLQERAERLWKVRGKTSNEIDPSLFAKKKVDANRDPEKQKKVAFDEFKVRKFIEILDENYQITIENVQRKQARNVGEHDDSDAELEEEDSDEETPNSDVVYNPKNLPLGWDGKPIPYWLYKLHGLNLTYKCEICGNAVYKGPKAFQKHFAEWRHAQGMRCLGIPNTAHFANVTTIQDAISLWDKLKADKQKEKFQAKVEEEFEDSMGNVVSKKIYEDLKRQGIL